MILVDRKKAHLFTIAGPEMAGCSAIYLCFLSEAFFAALYYFLSYELSVLAEVMEHKYGDLSYNDLQSAVG